MQLLSAMSLAISLSLSLSLSVLTSRAAPTPPNSHGAIAAVVVEYVPLQTYEGFESPPAEETLAGLAGELGVRPAELYALSVFYTYDRLAATEKAALRERRDLNRTIDDEVRLCMWTIPSDCWPLWSNGHRRELQRPWAVIRENGEKEYDTRMEYVGRGEEVAAEWARVVQSKEQRWKTGRWSPVVSDCGHNHARELWNNSTSTLRCGLQPGGVEESRGSVSE